MPLLRNIADRCVALDRCGSRRTTQVATAAVYPAPSLRLPPAQSFRANRQLNANRNSRANRWATLGRAGWGLALCLAISPLFMGCSSLRSRLACRSEECTQLCEEARQARELGREDQADQLLNAAIRRRPTASQARLDLAEELWSSGRQIAAADLLTKMVAESPDDAPLALRLARMEFEIGRTAVATEMLRKAAQLDPDNPEVLRLRGEIAELQFDWAAALAAYHRLLQILPEDCSAQMAVAGIHMHRGQSDRAAHMLRSLAQDPGITAEQRRKAEWQLGICYAHLDRWTDAAAALQAAIPPKDATAEDWYRVAYGHSRSGNYDAAYQGLSRALELQPEHGPSLELARSIHLNDTAAVSAVVPAGFSPTTMATGPRSRERL